MRRVLVLALTVLLAVLAWRSAYLSYWRSQDSSLAPSAIAADPMLKVRDFDKFASHPDQFSAHATAIARNAQTALRSEPLQAVAMRQLGMVAAAPRGGTGIEYFMAAERISRRELIAQLMLIEQTAMDDDIAATLAHYDRVLLVYSASGQNLFPVLAKALPDMDVRAALGKYVARPWALDFLSNAIDLGADPASVTELMADLKMQIPPNDRDRITTAVIRQLLTRGHFSLAGDFVKVSHSGNPIDVDQIAMTPATSDARLAQLAWNFVNDDAFEVALDSSDRLTVRISSEKSGMVAERMTLLAPGDYLFTQAVGYDAATPPVRLQWSVRCLEAASSTEIWKQSLPITPGQTTYRSAFTVPQTCAAQSWRLTATADETQFESTASISNLALAKR